MFPNLKNITYFDEAQTPFAQETPFFLLRANKMAFSLVGKNKTTQEEW